jgi:predicted DNA-binding ribbon-helix-helix protein
VTLPKGGAVKRSVRIAGHPTSVSLEPEFWDALKDIAKARGLSINELVAEIDAGRTTNLSSALRVYVLTALKGRDAAGQR